MALKIGLTGGIGSGKTTAADTFAALGITVLRADTIARQLTQPGTPQYTQILKTFGTQILHPTNNTKTTSPKTTPPEINRPKLADLIYTDPQKRHQLETILHPPIRTQMYAHAEQDNGIYCILDIPLLLESNQHQQMTRVAVVDTNRQTRIARLQKNRGMPLQQIERIIQTQAPDPARLAIADDIIDNNHDLPHLKNQIKQLHQTYLNLFK